MVLLDPIQTPSGRERITRRPAWRLRLNDGRIVWAFAEPMGNGRVRITGYPSHPVDRAQSQPADGAKVIAGAGAGALIGGALAGPQGAVVGGLLGALFGIGGSGRGAS